MTLDRVANGKTTLSLSIIILVLAAALGLSLSLRPTSRVLSETSIVTSTETVTTSEIETAVVNHTVTTTVTPLQQVNESFSEHLLSFGSGNVSAILARYEQGANLTWEQAECFSGLFIVPHDARLLLDILSANVTRAWAVDNATLPKITIATNGSLLVNDTFALAMRTAHGNITSTISAEVVYTYSSGDWLISQETWHFLTFESGPGMCLFDAMIPRQNR
jgi:hypothetical protein